MKQDLEIGLEWLPPFDGTEEGVTFSEFRMCVDGLPATEVEDRLSQTLRSSILVSAYPLAFFLASNLVATALGTCPDTPSSGLATAA